MDGMDKMDGMDWGTVWRRALVHTVHAVHIVHSRRGRPPSPHFPLPDARAVRYHWDRGPHGAACVSRFQGYPFVPENYDPLKAERMLEEQARKESLSFQSLIEEMGDLPATEVRREEGGGAPGAPDRNLATGSLVDAGFLGMDGGTMPGDVDQPAAPRRKPNENDFRVLTGSSPKRTPIWLQTLLTGGASVLLLLPVSGKSSGYVYYQPWYSYGVMFLAAVTVLWSLYGVYREEENRDRALCAIGLVLGLAAAVGAWLVSSPTPLPR